jgi:ABC-type phosphate transport system substrate-binding protein
MKYLLILLTLFPITGNSNDIIINKGDSNLSKDSYNRLLYIFTRRELYWDSGEKITVYIKPMNSIEHSIFTIDWLGISVFRYKRLLKREVYSGETSDVSIVLTDLDMLTAITNTPYSIGYLSDGTLVYSNGMEEHIANLRVMYYD